MLLIVKSKAEGANFENYMDGLRDLAAELDAQYQKGGEFYFNQLDNDHPAMIFYPRTFPDHAIVPSMNSPQATKIPEKVLRVILKGDPTDVPKWIHKKILGKKPLNLKIVPYKPPPPTE